MEWLALGETDMAKQHHEDGSLAWKVVQVRWAARWPEVSGSSPAMLAAAGGLSLAWQRSN